eukprot:353535-Chlamydomonas_euryale.AAC.3
MLSHTDAVATAVAPTEASYEAWSRCPPVGAGRQVRSASEVPNFVSFTKTLSAPVRPCQAANEYLDLTMQ